MKKKLKPQPEDGATHTVTISPELREVLIAQREAFVKKFGRKPRLTKSVFFDPSLDDPQALDADEVTATLVKACEESGIDADQLFAHLGWGHDLDVYRTKLQ